MATVVTCPTKEKPMPEAAMVHESMVSMPTAPLADCSRAQVEQRYVDAVNALMAQAVEGESVPILADVMAWALGRVIVLYGTPAVAGDIVRRLGGYVCDFAAREQARNEAEQAREEGRQPH
jgi:hypothetical protein